MVLLDRLLAFFAGGIFGITITIAFILFALVGCAPDTQYVSPPLVDYSKEFQQRAALELDAIKDTAPNICQMITDYAKLRDAIRKAKQSAACVLCEGRERIAGVGAAMTPTFSGPAPAPPVGAGHPIRQTLPDGDQF